MRSFRQLAALTAIGSACAFLALPASAAPAGLWDHNGSLMRFEENGKKRKFVYEQPRSGLTTAGVTPGAVFFDGEEKADGRLSGYAKLFRKGCDPVDYFVEGAYDTAKGELLLQGQAPVYSGEACKITGYSEEGASSSLVFTYQGGGRDAVARNDAGPVDTGPVDEDAVGGQSFAASPPAAFADEPVDEEPLYADPRNDRRYGSDSYRPRSYADQRDDYRRPYSRYDRVAPAPAYPEDEDDDLYYEDDYEDEPAYVPFRPWRPRY